ncbi:sigma-70 family RNA polymerase sigma factor [Kitasatospora sp. MAP5-34]|uniref:sigma-70 family RNA polymerase sigma factor n=1 Tax=Kitasatospora sp. MAP5-34 TaxID=3035102 RepID=UPI002476EC2C|nr:sigma-70 family RNA polymerase sigma factor [Kitasatospora sp. MAP5-34]
MSAEEQNDCGYGRDLPGQVPDQAGAPLRESLAGRVPGQAPAGQGGVTPEAFVTSDPGRESTRDPRRDQGFDPTRGAGRDPARAGAGSEDSLPHAMVPAPADPVDGERPPSDAELAALVRAGDDGAYEEIYRRHTDSVRRYARTCCRDSFTAEDLAGEVFARTLQALRVGKGPEFAVRAYLLTAVRNVAAAWARSERREQLVDDFGAFAQTSAATTALDLADPGADTWAMAMADQRMVMQAFVELPEDDRMVLWHTEVERESPKTVAVMLGKTANATAVQAHRARDRLAAGFLQAHVSGSQDQDCAAYANRLGAYARGSLRKRASAEVGRHVQECDRCTAAYLELTEINTGLRALLPGGVLVWIGTGYFTAAAAAVGVGAVGVGAVAGGAAAGGATAGGAAAGGAAAGSAGGGSGGGAGAVAGEGLGTAAKAGIVAGVAVAAAAAVAYAFTGAPEPKQPVAAPAVSSPALPPPVAPAPAAPSPSPSVSPSEAPAPAPTPRPPSPSPSPRPNRAAVPSPTPTPPVETPTPEPPTPPVPAPPAPPTPIPVPVPTITPPVPPTPPPPVVSPTDFWVDNLPFGQGSNRVPPTGPTIRRDSGWLWQRDGLWLNGEYHRHGLGVRAPSTVTIDLNRPCTSFQAVTGLDDFSLRVGDVAFSVQGGDGRTLWSSGEVRPGDSPLPVQVPLDGQQSIRLVVTPAGGSWGLINLADWADARFVC